MPPLPRRRRRERDLGRELFAIFQLVLTGDLGFDALFRRVAAILTSNVTDVFVSSFRNVAPEGLTNSTEIGSALGAQWAQQHATGLAAELVRNITRELNAGRDPRQVLSAERASSLATTEITRAVSQGETASRRVAAEQASSGRPSGDEGRASSIVGAGPLDLDDGFVAVWIVVTDGGRPDDRVCPICEPLHKRLESDWRDQFPLGPPAHPNCRCHLEYVPAGEDVTQWLRRR